MGMRWGRRSGTSSSGGSNKKSIKADKAWKKVKDKSILAISKNRKKIIIASLIGMVVYKRVLKNKIGTYNYNRVGNKYGGFDPKSVINSKFIRDVAIPMTTNLLEGG